jgi:CheY-like chemotaxis protein
MQASSGVADLLPYEGRHRLPSSRKAFTTLEGLRAHAVSAMNLLSIPISLYMPGTSFRYRKVMSAASSHIEPNVRTLRILIADDQPIIRKHVRRILEEQPSFSVCGEAYDGAKAIEEAQRLKPDVVVLNVSMPILNGLAAGRKIKAELPETAIVILSSNADKHFVEEAKKIGARAYVAKSKAAEALVTAIERAIINGEFVLVD